MEYDQEQNLSFVAGAQILKFDRILRGVSEETLKTRNRIHIWRATADEPAGPDLPFPNNL
jgi:hypothetical protein